MREKWYVHEVRDYLIFRKEIGTPIKIFQGSEGSDHCKQLDKLGPYQSVVERILENLLHQATSACLYGRFFCSLLARDQVYNKEAEIGHPRWIYLHHTVSWLELERYFQSKNSREVKYSDGSQWEDFHKGRQLASTHQDWPIHLVQGIMVQPRWRAHQEKFNQLCSQ